MHDPWIARISDSIDGQLGAREEQELQEHLAGCAECREIAAELRNVVAAAHEAPMLEPASDLWPQIAARLGEPAGKPSLAQLAALSPMRAAGSAAHAPRRFSFSAPQLAAAAVMLMALSGAAVWMIGGGPAAPAVSTGTIIQSAGGPPRTVQPVAATVPASYYDDVATLESALEENRGQLDPATVDVIERSLEAIDRAIADARSALAADPGNPYLHRQLDNTMRRKIDVLRRATGAQRAQS